MIIRDLKKWTSIGLVLALAGMLAACGPKGEQAGSGSQPSASPSSMVQSPAQNGETSQQPLPLTGLNVLTGLPAAEGMLEGQRPVGIMIKNDARALPQRGLAAGDMLVEMPIDGMDTALMVLYADYRAISTLGPVGSTEDQFVQFALPLDAIQAHIGTSTYAGNLLAVTQTKHIDGLYLGKTSFGFDNQRTLPRPGGNLHENCWFTDGNLLLAGMTYLDIYTVSQPKPLTGFASSPASASNVAAVVNVQYTDTAVAGFALNTGDGLYYKTYAGNPHTDENGTPLAYTNLLLFNIDITKKSGF